MSRQGRRLLVTVHDVCPSRLGPVRAALADLDRLAVDRRVLMVIPEELETQQMRPDHQFARLLRAEVERGGELVLHGFSHRAGPGGQHLGPTRLRQALFARGAAEFTGLTQAQAEARLLRGLRVLDALGLPILGFCPPGWLSAPTLRPALLNTGMGFRVGMSYVEEVRRGRRLLTPWYGQIGEGPLHEALVEVGGRLMLATVGGWAAVKVFLHPGSGHGQAKWERTLAVIRRLRTDREPATFGELLELHPERAGGGSGNRSLIRDPGPQ